MCNIRGLGIDLCQISRMADLLQSGRSLHRMFTEDEERYIRSKNVSAAQTMAGLFAAKEAVLKAFGTGLSVALTDIIISHTPKGQPLVTLTGQAAELGGSVLISITHEGDMAAATAIWMA